MIYCKETLLLIVSLNYRFQDQHFPIDLPPSSPTQLQEDEQIVIEHKSLDELNAVDPYEFPVCPINH